MPPVAFPDPGTTFHRRVVIPPETPVVLSVPHAGTETTGFEQALAPDLDVRGDADLLVHHLYGVDLEPGLDATQASHRMPHVYVAARLSRFVCDMNRHPDDVSPSVVPEHPAPRNTDARGFIWGATTTGAAALARPLTLVEWEARRAIHTAYHAAISEALARARNRFGFALLLDGHSMPSVGRAGHKDPGRSRADVVPGDRDGASCSPALSALVEKHFKSEGYTVCFNDPYKGGFITAHHGDPANGVHAIQIEVRRDLYMDEATFMPRAEGLARMQDTLATLTTALGRWRP